MYRIISLISLLLLCISYVSCATSCFQDYECGAAPYNYCNVPKCSSTIKGLAIDEAARQVYYMQTCDSGSYYPNITLKRVSTGGSSPVDIQSRTVIPAPGNPAIVLDYSGQWVYYGLAYRSPGYTLSALNVATLQEQRGIPTTSQAGYYYNILDFGATPTQGTTSFVCNFLYSINGSSGYTIERINGVVGQGLQTGDNVVSQPIYKLPGFNSCGSVKKNAGSNYLYFVESEYNTNYTIVRYTFRRVLANCTPVSPAAGGAGLCTGVQTLFTVNDEVSDFENYGDDVIYYGTATGLFSRPINGGSATQLTGGVITGVRIFSGRVYYNDNYNIRSIPLGGGASQLVSRPASGSCSCRSGFSGSDCRTCNGMIQWSNGVPSCVAIENGAPTTCTESWQCGNTPYTVCVNNGCQCASGFTGKPSCSTCASPKAVSWSNGIPTCA